MMNESDLTDTPRRKGLIAALTGDDGGTPLMGTNDPAAPIGLGPATAAATPAVPDMIGAVAPPPQDYGRLNAGYDVGKLNDPNKQSAKYVMGRTLAGFDPTQGISADALKALNGLGYGTFSGSGDKLSLSGLTDAGRQAGLVGDYKDADFIQGLKGGSGKWNYADPAEEARQGMAAPAGSGGGFGGVPISGMLSQSNPLDNIQQALGNIGGDNSRLQQLIAQLGRG